MTASEAKNTSTGPVRWGIIGPGRIAKTFASGLTQLADARLVAIGTRSPDRPGLAADFPGARIVHGYQALIDDPEVEAIYIATPHPQHAEWCIKAAEAGKHVLCQKPITLSAFEADAVLHAAKKHNVFMGEAFMYRHHPMTARLLEIVRSGEIGQIRLIRSAMGFRQADLSPETRHFANELAGGGILDLGCYPVSMVRLIAGAVEGRPFLEPIRTGGLGYLGKTGVDETASLALEFANGIIAEVSCSMALQQDNVLHIFGTAGRIEVPEFWFASGRQGGVGKIRVIAPDQSVRVVEVDEPRWLYSIEAEAAGKAIREGRLEFAAPGMSWDDTLGNMRVLDQWRAAVGLAYEIEKPAHRTKTLRGDRLTVGASPILKQRVPGMRQDTSRVAMGFESFADFAGAGIMLDAFFERGGNLFDTAWTYRAGDVEKHFGQWHTSRGLKRDDFVLIGKGAIAPLTYPDVIGRQMTQSFERLQVDYVDVYFMHRDNPDIPVGEFIDAMNVEIDRGRIRGIIGGSNWTMKRIDEANAYAKANGKQGLGAFSNNFSLAVMVDPVWPGCIQSSDKAWKDWAHDRQITNFAWSSQGRGFFTDNAGRGVNLIPEIVRSWYSDDNFQRRDRAVELARKLNCSPIQIALAYAFSQSFPTVPLIGPRRISELEESVAALSIRLIPEQVAWLAGEEVRHSPAQSRASLVGA